MLADEFVDHIHNHRMRPCSWTSHCMESFATPEELFYLKKALFLADGSTILLKDGSAVQRTNPLYKYSWTAIQYFN